MTSVQERSDGELRLFLNPNLTTASQSLVLLVGAERFAFAHADTMGVNTRYWNNSGLSWSSGATVELKLVEASTIATLSDLEIEDGTGAEVELTPGFSSGTTPYTASVANSVSRITLTETPVDANAWVDYLDGDGTALTDLDTGTTGHQVDLDPGDNVIQVKVTAEDGVATRTYTVTVTREAGQPVTVDIEPNYDSIGAGLEDLVFTLTREGATTAELEATVTIVQDQSWLVNSDRSHTVTFTAGSATATLTLAASRFSFDPDTSGDLTATVAVAGVSSGEATVEIISTADAPITISYDMSSYTFAEDAAAVNIYVVATLDPVYPRAPSRSFFVNFSTLPDTATFTQDYVTIIWTSQFVHGNFAPDASGFVARKRLRHNNGAYFGVENDEVYEGPEGLVVRIARDASLPPGLLQFAYPDGTTCESHTCPLTIEYPVTITDEEDRPVLSLSAAPASIAEEDDDTTTNVAENVSTLTVAAASPKTFATGQTITLTFAGSAVYDTHYSVAPADTDANTTGHQVVLPAETASVQVTVTAATNDTADGHRSIAVTGSRDGTAFGTATTITLLDDETTTSTPAPELVGAEVPVSGDRLILTYDVDLDLGGRLPPAEAFTVEDDGDEVTVQSVAEGVGTNDFILNLLTAIGMGQTVTVSYTVPSTNAIRDLDGIEALPFTYEPVANNSEVQPNTDPVFDEDMVTFEIAENQPVGTDIGDPVTATDAEGDDLEYSLVDTPYAGNFSIDAATGQLRSDSLLDFEGATVGRPNMLAISVVADDGRGGTAQATVVVNVTDVDEPPEAPAEPTVTPVAGSTTSLSVTWTEPSNKGPAIDGYDLRYRVETTSGWTDGPEDVTATTETLTGLAVGTSYKVQVRAINAEGDGAWSVEGTGRTTTTTNTPATGQPGISGTAQVGQMLTATTSGITDVDGKTKAEGGDSGYAYTYQWILVDGNTENDISGETSSTYTPSSSDVGKTIRVRVSFTDDLNNAEGPFTSEQTATVIEVAAAGICGRTLAVRAAILNKISSVSDCANVTDTHLAAITGGLSLSNRNVTALAVGDFAGLDALTRLNLHDNALTTLPAGVFGGLDALTRLTLHDNALTMLPAGVFGGLDALTELKLYNNALTALPAGVFAGLDMLTTLSLSNSGLDALPDGVFAPLTALTTLYLSSNGLATLPAGVFAGLATLTKLRLNDNALIALPAGVFAGLDALTTLWLNNNALTALPAGVFAGLDMLTTLWLDDNALTALPDDVFEPLAALTELKLANNPRGPFAPTAEALPDDGTVSDEGGTVTLDGSDSGGAWGTNVTYSWVQSTSTNGVTFDDNTSATTDVVIPALAADTVLIFTLTVTGKGGTSGIDTDTDTATVTVTETTTSTDATLSGLTLQDGEGTVITLSPTFPSDMTTDYTAQVANGVDTVTLTATQNDSTATVAIADDGDTNKPGEAVLNLDVGSNTLTVMVTAEDGTTKTYTVTVTRAAANTAPTATDSLVTTDEDTAHHFAASEFNFNDTDAGDTLASVTVVTLPTVGALALNSTAVTAGKVVEAEDIGKLVFTPAQDANGTSYASFTFRVSDGTDESAEDYIMTVNVTAVNDDATGKPTIMGTAQVGETLTAGTSDIMDADGLPSSFTYQWVRVDSDGTSNEMDIGLNSDTYTLMAADEGKKVKVKVTFNDDGGTTETVTSDVYPASGTITPGTPTNTVPTATDSLVTTDEDTAHHFAASEFNFNDTDAGDTLASVTVVTLPAAGALALNSTAVTAGRVVAAADIVTLVFTPAQDANGTSYASFTFRVSDGTDESAADYSMTMNVTAVNDAATGTPMISGTAQVGEILTASTSGISDNDGLTNVSFTYQWVREDANGSNPADIGTNSDTYTLMADDVGKKIRVKVSFTDDGGTTETVTSDAYPASGTIALGTPTNTAPTATDSLVTTDEDTAHDFAASEFNFEDTDAGDTLASVTVVTLPTVGALALDGTAVTAGDTVTKSQLDADQLTFMPAADGNGDAYASFTFRVSDGTDESAADYSMTVNVTAVNDAATGTPMISGTAQVGEILTASTSGISDNDGLINVSFTYQWVREDANGSNPADIGTNSDTYTLMAADEGKKVKVKVTFTDNGGTTETVTSDVYPASGTITPGTPTNTAPTATDSLVTTDEDTAHHFAASEFNFEDTDAGDTLASVTVVTLPTVGALALNSTAVTAGDTVTKSQLDADQLTFMPAADGNGDAYASFTFRVSDGTDESAADYSMTVNVTAVNDAATGTPMISGTAQVGEILTASTSGISDNDGLINVSFTYQWVREDANGSNPADIGTNSDTYTLMAADEGKKVKVKVTFTDNGGTTETVTSDVYPASGTITPGTPTNTAPTATDSLVTTDEDTAHHFAASEFNFEDTDPGDTLASVTVVTLPAVGALALDGTPVTAGKVVEAVDIGKLVFTPVLNANGTSYASFTFRVSDGTDESAADYSMTVNVTAVNDAATGKPTIEGTAQAGETLMAGTSGIMDADGLPSSFTYQWVRVDSDGTSNEMDIGSNSDTYTLMADDVGKKVKVKVTFTDNGGTTETVTSDAYPSSGTIATAGICDRTPCGARRVGVSDFRCR